MNLYDNTNTSSDDIDPTKIDLTTAFIKENKANYSPIPELRYDHGFGKDHDDLRIPLLLGSLVIVTVVSFLFYRASKVKPIKPLVLLPTPIAKQIIASPSTIPTGVLNTTDSADLPPLYPGIEWEATSEGIIMIGKQNGEILNAQGFITRSKGGYSGITINEFFNYYREELSKRGWLESLSTSGDDGDTAGYEKNNKHITISSKSFGDVGSGVALFVEFD